MSGTKAIWIVALLLLGAAITLALLPPPDSTPSDRARMMQAEDVAVESPSIEPNRVAPTATPAPTVAPKPAKPAVERAPDAVNLGLDQTINDAVVVAGNIVPKKDAATGEEYLLADGKYEIRGQGTKDNPYRVSWECLASASKTYLPRLNEHEIPQRIALLNGHWLRIDGFLAFPLMLSESKELMIMLNQWDGCCIG
ncbi:MAG: cell envelope integrity protein TolA, partial [Phycisphaerae bacterium]|nr:cell envelope integrity protein TolA [Phycisphaerae bacterium]